MSQQIPVIVGDFGEDYGLIAPHRTLEAVAYDVDTVCPDTEAGEAIETAIHDFRRHRTCLERRGHDLEVTPPSTRSTPPTTARSSPENANRSTSARTTSYPSGWLRSYTCSMPEARPERPRRPTTDTVGYTYVTGFDTPGCRTPPRDDSQQYEHASSRPDHGSVDGIGATAV